MAIHNEPTVLLTSFKRDGDGVGTPVWIAPLGDGTSGFTTPTGSWKVKRIRREPRVTVQACDVRGTPTPGSEPVEMHATVHDDAPTMARVRGAIAAKYGIQHRLVGLAERVAGFVRHRRVERYVIVLAPIA